MKNIYCLQGIHDTGKTTTLRLLKDSIEGKYNVFSNFPNNRGRDFYAVFENIKGYTIGICSEGDNIMGVDKKFKILEKANCDIIFCACRSFGKTVDYIQSKKSKDFVVNFIQKNIATEKEFQYEQNLKQAKELLINAGL